MLVTPLVGNNPGSLGISRTFQNFRLSGKTMVLVEHDLVLVTGVSDHVVVLDGGSRIAAGSPEAIRTNPWCWKPTSVA